jgi:hypothetical protein
VAGSCEHGNELFGTTKGLEIVDTERPIASLIYLARMSVAQSI